jgi:peptide/nickel transport system permease protein
VTTLVATDATGDRRASGVRHRRVGVLRRAARLARVKVGVALVVAVVLLATIGPFVAPRGATEYAGRPNTTGVAGALFGTDGLGQDVWSRFLLGGRAILLVASIAAAIGVVVGATAGAVAAHARGRVDEVVMRVVDVLLALPPILLALVAMTVVGPEPWLVVASVALVTAPRVARVSHGAAAAVVARDFVETSECLGEPRWRTVAVDVVPNIAGALLVEVGIRFAYAIAIVTSLAFLGFTTDTNAANWGSMVQENRAAFSVQPWGVLLPTAAIVAVTTGAGLIADGIGRVASGGDGLGEP